MIFYDLGLQSFLLVTTTIGTQIIDGEEACCLSNRRPFVTAQGLAKVMHDLSRTNEVVAALEP